MQKFSLSVLGGLMSLAIVQQSQAVGMFAPAPAMLMSPVNVHSIYPYPIQSRQSSWLISRSNHYQKLQANTPLKKQSKYSAKKQLRPVVKNPLLGASVPFVAGIGSSGAATSHGDTLSSDTTFQKGPLSSKTNPQLIPLAAACPNIMTLSDGKVMLTCVDFLTRNPKVILLSAEGKVLAQRMLSSGSLLGSVYAYANEKDQVMFVNADNDLVTIDAKQHNGKWSLNIVDKISIHQAVTAYCGDKIGCDSVVAINAGSDVDDIWFVTQGSVVGVVNRKTKQVIHTKLSKDANEIIANSFSTNTHNRASIVTNKALYLLVKKDNKIITKWRNAYDVGIARKPGQLSHGSGATPTFFGPSTSSDFVTIIDNAFPISNLLVYRAGMDNQSGALVCKTPIFSANNSGTEDSSIAFNRSIVISSTYGYPYPKYPDIAGQSVPAKADFVGGMMRVDVNPDDSGCQVKWVNQVRSAALPKLSVADGVVYTVEREGPSDAATALDTYKFVNIDFATGKKISSRFFGFGLLSDPLQTAGNINQDRSYWQGTMNGVVRIQAN